MAEPFLTGREFTVGVVGNGAAARIVAVLEILLLQNAEPEVYSFENKELCESRVEYRLADDAEAQAAGATALAAYRTLGCRDGARLEDRKSTRPNTHHQSASRTPSPACTHKK